MLQPKSPFVRLLLKCSWDAHGILQLETQPPNRSSLTGWVRHLQLAAWVEEKGSVFTPKHRHGSVHLPHLLNLQQNTPNQGATNILEDRAAIHRGLTGWRNELPRTH